MAGNGQNFAGMPAFDLSALQNILNDPSIKQMAEQIANDPAFAQMQQALQASVTGGAAPGEAAGAGTSRAAEAGSAPEIPGIDPEQYASAMSKVLQNQNFMEMAEKLGQQIMSDPGMASMMQTMHDPTYRTKLEAKMSSMKDDPELAKILEEMESGGPAAMMKYWDDPSVLQKLSAAMGDAFNPEDAAAEAGAPGEEAPAGEEEDDGEEIANVAIAASSGDYDLLKELLTSGADVDDQDEEGRTGLHFSCGYGEMKCVNLLLEHKANVNAVDHNKNTALHYAAGYGQAEAVELLLKNGASCTAKNLDGKTAVEVAQLNNQNAIVAIFEKENTFL
ncbi:probable Ankyrin-3 at C-terminar half [Coccomyxa sp. Obi]|nr:probable Ankyrin-3 at C-terminar half [Coccomyxa sp. Obi]